MCPEVGGGQPQQQSDQGGLARPIGPYQPGYAGWDGEIDPGESADITEVFVEVPGFDDRRAACRGPVGPSLTGVGALGVHLAK